MKRPNIRRLGTLQYRDNLLHSRLVKLLRETRVVLTPRSPKLNLLKRPRTGGSVEGFLTSKQLFDLPGPVDNHHCGEREKELGQAENTLYMYIAYTTVYADRT